MQRKIEPGKREVNGGREGNKTTPLESTRHDPVSHSATAYPVNAASPSLCILIFTSNGGTLHNLPHIIIYAADEWNLRLT